MFPPSLPVVTDDDGGSTAAGILIESDFVSAPVALLAVAPKPVTDHLDVAGQVREYELDPRAVGLPLRAPADLAGGDPAANAAILRGILAGEPGPRREIVLLNAAAVLVAGQQARDLPAGLAAAAAAIASGAARRKLDDLVALTRAAAG